MHIWSYSFNYYSFRIVVPKARIEFKDIKNIKPAIRSFIARCPSIRIIPCCSLYESAERPKVSLPIKGHCVRVLGASVSPRLLVGVVAEDEDAGLGGPDVQGPWPLG